MRARDVTNISNDVLMSSLISTPLIASRKFMLPLNLPSESNHRGRAVADLMAERCASFIPGCASVLLEAETR
jgi:hypothetical protein